MALRAILFVSIILLFVEGGATGNENADDSEIPKISSYEARRFGLDSTNQAQLQEFFHPKSPKQYTETDKFASNNALADYPIQPTFVNGTLWHGTYDVNVVNGIAYVSMAEGMGIFDVSDPANPHLLTLYYAGHLVWDIHVKDSLLLFTNGGNGGYAIEALNVADPEHPIHLSQNGYGLSAQGVSNGGRYVYVCQRDGPVVYDFLNPDTLIKAGYKDIYSETYSICRVNNMGYLGGSSKLFIFDMMYSTPILNAQIDIPSQATSIAVRDNYAYVAACGYLTKNNLRIIDVSTPRQPVVANDWNDWTEGEGPYAVKIVDSLLYMSTYTGPVVVASLSDPINPEILGYISEPCCSHTMGIDVEGSYCYIAHEHKGFSVADISDPVNPFIASHAGVLSDWSQMWGILELEIIGNYAYVLDYIAGLIIIDITDPAKPIVLGHDRFSDTKGFDISGSKAYMAYGSNGVRVTDISDPSNPTYVSTYKTPGHARNVLVNGNYCYVAADTSGLQILDVTDPLNITRVGFYNADYYGGHEAYSIALKDSLVLLGTYFGLQIINVKDPANPTPISRSEFGQYCWDIKVRDNMVYLALDNGVASVDISNPAYPYVMKTISDYGDDPFNICLYDNYLLVANLGGGGNQVEIFDISTPGDMIPAGVIQTAGHYATDVAAIGKYIYVADYYGILVMDGDFPSLCGDADGSRIINLLDVSATINYLYRGGTIPDPSALDVDGSGKANLLDVSYLIKYMYRGGPAPHCGG